MGSLIPTLRRRWSNGISAFRSLLRNLSVLSGCCGFLAFVLTSCFPLFVPGTRNSSQTCPITAYTAEEYDIMRIVTGVVSAIGFILNVYMAATYMVCIVFKYHIERKHLIKKNIGLLQVGSTSSMRYGRKFGTRCFSAFCTGWSIRYLWYSFHHFLHTSDNTIVSFLTLLFSMYLQLLLKSKLPCYECDTEEWCVLYLLYICL